MVETMNRRERERQQHRAEILEAAEAVFAEKGFHGATVEDVARRAEFAVGTLYKFFGSKEDLYRSLIHERFIVLGETLLGEMAAAADPVGVIRAYVEGRIRLSCERASFVRLYVRERMGDRFSKTELWDDVVGPLYGRVMECLSGAFAAGKANGAYRGDMEPMDIAVALDGLMDGFMFEWLDDPERCDLAAKTEVILRMFHEGVSRR